MRIDDVPPSYLCECSDISLESFELRRLQDAANLEKQAKAILLEAAGHKTMAGVARWLREHRAELLRMVGSHGALHGTVISSQVVQDDSGNPVAQRAALDGPPQGFAADGPLRRTA